MDRAEQGLKPRFVKLEPPTDNDIAEVVGKISQRVIRKLRQLGYLEAGIEAPIATGYDPLADDEPDLARSMAASVQQHITFGERAGQQVRRTGLGASAPRGKWGSRLHLHAALLGRHDRDQTVAFGMTRKALGADPAATRSPGALWRVPDSSRKFSPVHAK